MSSPLRSFYLGNKFSLSYQCSTTVSVLELRQWPSLQFVGAGCVWPLHIHTSPAMPSRPPNPRYSLVPLEHKGRTEKMQIFGMKRKERQGQGDPRHWALSKGFVGGWEEGRRVWEYGGGWVLDRKLHLQLRQQKINWGKQRMGNTVWNAFWSISLTIFY